MTIVSLTDFEQELYRLINRARKGGLYDHEIANSIRKKLYFDWEKEAP